MNHPKYRDEQSLCVKSHLFMYVKMSSQMDGKWLLAVCHGQELSDDIFHQRHMMRWNISHFALNPDFIKILQ